jgi:hypothetical protein
MYRDLRQHAASPWRPASCTPSRADARIAAPVQSGGSNVTDAAEGRGRDAGGSSDHARMHRSVDEDVTARIESFLAERVADGEPFTAADLARSVAIPRFDERQAQLFLVALKTQGRAHYDWAGWRAGPAPA